jgi:hypothetical protein
MSRLDKLKVERVPARTHSTLNGSLRQLARHFHVRKSTIARERKCD